jgi:NADPH-dependent 2,4-dienoyl-CoA reductase/sulfur reductase-like enzyme
MEPFVVVGGDAAGLSAASKLKRDQPEREVLVFERGQWVSYAHCGMPYFIEGKVATLGDLLTLSPEDIAERGIDLRRGHEVTAVDTDARTVTVAGPDGTHQQPYGDLLVATGAHARTGPIEGADLDCAFAIHGLDSAAAVRAFLCGRDEDPHALVGGEEFVDHDLVERYGAMDPPETIAIVGGGYVGIEMAEALTSHDIEVHLFQRPDHVLEAFGEAVAERVEAHLREQGVHLHLGTEVERLAGDGRVETVECANVSLPVDGAVVGIGVRPNTGLVDGTGIELGAGDAIAIDEYGRTSVEGVYAAGDCAEMTHVVTGEQVWVPLGLTANRAGRAIGRTLAGEPTPVGGIAGTAVVKAFDLECGRTGITDHEAAREAGFDPVSRTVDASSRSGYYPGSAETTVTLTADRETGRLLGGTIVGADRAAIRIDTVATALEAGLTVAEVERLDLAYAPPFSPVWDPVLVAAKVLNGAL